MEVKTMKPMKYKNDLEMWHKFAEFAEHLKFVADAEEQRLYFKCQFYSWDDHAFEEYCSNEKKIREVDFEARTECWKCPFFSIQKKEEAKPT